MSLIVNIKLIERFSVRRGKYVLFIDNDSKSKKLRLHYYNGEGEFQAFFKREGELLKLTKTTEGRNGKLLLLNYKLIKGAQLHADEFKALLSRLHNFIVKHEKVKDFYLKNVEVPEFVYDSDICLDEWCDRVQGNYYTEGLKIRWKDTSKTGIILTWQRDYGVCEIEFCKKQGYFVINPNSVLQSGLFVDEETVHGKYTLQNIINYICTK